MIWLPSVFSDKALFQQRSELNIHGKSAANSKITAKLIKLPSAANNCVSCETVCEAAASADENGRFGLELKTPAASLDKYDIILTENSENEYIIHDVLFGELWIAAGQSNMEFPNSSQLESASYLPEMKEMPIRAYFVGGWRGTFPYSFEPREDTAGHWCDIHDPESFRQVSALATAFVRVLYEKAGKDKSIPFGFVNVNLGSTNIETWLSRETVMSNEEIYNNLKQKDVLPEKKRFDKFVEDDDYSYTCVQYNEKIASLIGIKAKGIIWYQGEGNASTEPSDREHHYKRCLCALRESYAKLFKTENADTFPMIISQIFPFSYGRSGECSMHLINTAISNAAAEDRKNFFYLPIYNLSPVWAFFEGNVALHPAHKYEAGTGLAHIALNNIYGQGGEKFAPLFRSFRRNGHALEIKFEIDESTGSALEIRGRRLIGAYICGENGLYVEAEGKVTAPDTLLLYNKYIDKPVHAAYSQPSMSAEGNLFGSTFPATAFITDIAHDIKIERKPFMHPEITSIWVYNWHDDVGDVFSRPVWFASPDSEICSDTVFISDTRINYDMYDGSDHALQLARSLDKKASLRIFGEGDEIGAFVKKYAYNHLDFENYSALRFSVLNNLAKDCRVLLTVKKGEEREIVKIEGKKLEELKYGWSKYEADLSSITPDSGDIEKMEIKFNVSESMYKFVNLDDFELIPKQ